MNLVNFESDMENSTIDYYYLHSDIGTLLSHGVPTIKQNDPILNLTPENITQHSGIE